MIEIIKQIGHVVQGIEGKEEIIKLWQKDVKPLDNIIEINLDDEANVIGDQIRSYYPEVIYESIYYSNANDFKGSGFIVTKEEDINEKRINSILTFLNIKPKDIIDLQKSVIRLFDSAPNQTYFVHFKKNGLCAINLKKDEFTKLIKEQYFNKSKNIGNCHICNYNGEIFTTAVYKVYNDDKKIYQNTTGETFYICEQCLVDILHGKHHIENTLSTYWIDSQVMFLPNSYNKTMYNIYTKAQITDESGSKLLRDINKNEQRVMRVIGEQNSIVDIIFYYDPKASQEWKVEYAIKGVLPSRFSQLSNLLEKYRNQYNGYPLSLREVIQTIGITDKGQEPKRILSHIFKGRKLPRDLVLRRLIQSYKKGFIEHNVKTMKKYHRIYNFLCEVDCLDKMWYQVVQKEGGYEDMEYQTLDEFFEVNKAYFDSPKKKAWFLLGKSFNTTIYYARQYNETDNSEVRTTHLEKSFFYSRKFDDKTFILLANKCSDAIFKYGVEKTGYIKKQLTQAKELYSNDSSNLSIDEAKYIFFWGMDQFIKVKED